MILTLVDIGAIAIIVGLIVSPLYMLYISLNRSYSQMNRELGELKRTLEGKRGH